MSLPCKLIVCQSVFVLLCWSSVGHGRRVHVPVQSSPPVAGQASDCLHMVNPVPAMSHSSESANCKDASNVLRVLATLVLALNLRSSFNFPHVGVRKLDQFIRSSPCRPGLTASSIWSRCIRYTPVLKASSSSDGLHFPTHVSSFAVQAIPVHWSLDFPAVTTLAVSSEPDADGMLSSELRAYNELDDSHGVLGNWPSARVAACELAALAPASRRRVLELGAGAGLPSLVAALRLPGVERVLATDVEPLALELLAAAHTAQATSAAARLETRELDVCDMDAARTVLEDAGGFDVIMVADMLYNRDVATALGKLLGGAVSRDPTQAKPCPTLIICDSVRLVRSDFEESFRAASGHADAAFVDVDLPVIDDAEIVTDLFISKEKPRVSVLRWSEPVEKEKRAS